MAAPTKYQGPKTRTFSGTSADLTFDSACTNPSTVIANCTIEDGATTIAVSDPTNGTYTIDKEATTNNSDTGGGRVSIQRKDNTATSALTVTITPSAGTVGTFSITELEPVEKDGTGGSNAGSLADNDASFTTGSANSYGFSSGVFYPNTGAIADSGWTAVYSAVAGSNSYHFAQENGDLGAAGSKSVTFDKTDSENNYATVVQAYKTTAAGATFVTPSGIASDEAFGSHTVSPGAVTVSPSGIASLEAFGSHTVTPGVVTVSPSGIASLESFGSLSLSLTIVPSGIASDETFGTHTVSPGAVTISPSGIASEEAFGTATLVLTISVSSIDSLEAFGSHTVTPGAVSITPSGIASLEAFGDAVVASGVSSITPTGIDSLEAFGSPTVTPGAVTVAPSGIASDEAFGTASLSLVIAPASIDSLEAFGTPTVTPGAVTISPSGIDSLEAFGTLSIVTQGTVLSVGVASEEVFGSPVVTAAYFSGYTIDGANEVVLTNPYQTITVYANESGNFFTI